MASSGILGGPRLANGVRAKVVPFKAGDDLWAYEHRSVMPKAYLTDIDCLQWADGSPTAWTYHSEQHLYLEYEPDVRENLSDPDRSFAIVAVFDRKATAAGAQLEHAKSSGQVQRWLCRELGGQQPVGGRPQFFYVIGPENHGPWRLIRTNLTSGEWEEEWTLETNSWERVWRAAGISKVRETLHRWMHTP